MVILASRNLSKLKTTEETILKEHPNANLRSLVLDLASPQSIRTAADEVNSYTEGIDVVIQNAAIMNVPTRVESAWPGYELQFATNHLGPFLFINLIKPALAKSAAPRVVAVASTGHCYSDIRYDDPGFSSGCEFFVPLIAVRCVLTRCYR